MKDQSYKKYKISLTSQCTDCQFQYLLMLVALDSHLSNVFGLRNKPQLKVKCLNYHESHPISIGIHLYLELMKNDIWIVSWGLFLSIHSAQFDTQDICLYFHSQQCHFFHHILQKHYKIERMSMKLANAYIAVDLGILSCKFLL